MNDAPHHSAELPAAVTGALAEARRWVVMTGSGVSAESGVATFRDAQTGLWARYDPQQLATPGAFERDPQLVWQWYQWRRGQITRTDPNPGHRALAELQRIKSGLILVTQNVDGLHQRAGSRDVIEFHGNIHRNRCLRCDRPGPESADAHPPSCAHCGDLLRPDVVWFGEAIPVAALEAATRAVEACDLFLSVGTSSLVYPAAALAETALRLRSPVVEINPNPTPLSTRADFTLRGRAGVWLPIIAERLRSGS